MNKKAIPIALLLLAFLLNSCKKTPDYSLLINPYPLFDPSMLSSGGTQLPLACQESFPNVWGFFIMEKYFGALDFNQNGVFDTSSTDFVGAAFAGNSAGTYQYAGKVTFNNIPIDTNSSSPNGYSDIEQGGTVFNFTNGCNWVVSGLGSIPSFSYNYTGAYPNYTGSLPHSFTIANGITIPVNSANTVGADTIIVSISDVSGNTVCQKVAVTAGNIILSPATLSSLVANGSDNNILQLQFCRTIYQVFNRKQYAFFMQYVLAQGILLH